MSDLKDYGYSPASAAKFNARAANKVGWGNAIPERALQEFPRLRGESGTVEFAEAVHDMQRALFIDEDDFDGKLGRGTWRALLSQYDPVAANYVVYRGRRLELPQGHGYEVVCFDERGGLDLHREADFQRGRHKDHPLTFIGLHWAGGIFTAKRLYNIFENAVFDEDGTIIDDPRNVSSHGAIELSKDGKVRVYQYLDLHHRAWHGGKMNRRSVGFDVLWDPRRKYYDRMMSDPLRRYDEVEMKKNPTRPRRGKSSYCTLDRRLRLGTRAFLYDLLKVLDLGDPLIPLGADGLQKTGTPFEGVITSKAFKDGRLIANLVPHSNATEKKIDIACYMRELFPEFYA